MAADVMVRTGLPESRANFSRKKFGEGGDVLFVVAKRRNIDGDDIEAIVEVFAEGAIFERGAEIAIGGGDEADVHFDGFRAAEALEFALLKDAQEFHLRGGGNVADFVEEERAFIGQSRIFRACSRRRRKMRPFRSRKARFREEFRGWRCY